MSTLNLNNVIDALQEVLPKKKKSVALHEPCFSGNEWSYVKDCLDTAWVSTAGKYVDRFEQMLQDFIGVKRAVAVVNGTAALHTCLILVGVQPGDEVIVPALTFVATANAVTYCGAIPHFADCEETTLGLDPKKLQDYLLDVCEIRPEGSVNKKTGRRIKAVIPMHTFGHPVDLDSLVELCIQFKLELIEDAAESIGSYYKGRHTGNLGKVAACSFNGNKTITTGGGGAILTNDEELGRLAKHLTTTAKVPHAWALMHDRIGYNYRLPNINAALGCAQMEELPEFLKTKRQLAQKYRNVFKGMDGIRFFTEPEFGRSNYWLNTLLLDDDNTDKLDNLLELTNHLGIMTRPAWTLMHKLPMFKDHPRMDLSGAGNIKARLINIPSSVVI